jgi:hypothetical protein
MEEAPANGNESSHSAHANGVNEWMNELINIGIIPRERHFDITPASSSIGTGVVSRVYIGAGVKFTTHIRLIPRLRKSGVIPILPPTCLHERTGTTLPLCHISSKGQDYDAELSTLT